MRKSTNCSQILRRSFQFDVIVNTRFRKFHNKIRCGENFTIFAVKIWRTLAYVFFVETFIAPKKNGVRQTNSIISTRIVIAWRIDLRTIEAFSTQRALASIAVSRCRRHPLINALSTLVARKVIARPQMASSSDYTRRT